MSSTGFILKSIYRPFSPSKSNESWDDDGLPKIPTHEIFNPPKEQGSIDMDITSRFV